MFESGELVQQSIQFSIQLIIYYRWLCQEKREYVLSRQVLKSGTSIGANIHEARYAQSKADFNAKMQISLKEAAETQYWFFILEASDFLPEEFAHLVKKCESLKRMLVKSLPTSKNSKPINNQ